MLECSKSLYTKLTTTSNITDIVATIPTGDKAIFNSNPIPLDFIDSYPSINFYRVSNHALNQVWTDITFIVNCWSKSLLECEELGFSVAYNLSETSSNGFRFLTQILPVISIDEEGGVYNCPVEVRVSKNSALSSE